MQQLEAVNIKLEGRLGISDRANIIMPYHGVVIKVVKRTMENLKKLVQRDAVSDLPMRIRLREQVLGLVI
ncbi:MAG: hypothetical protein Ct9H300mP23_07580 [Nitrospinota bacterium]|nr:MAG: hypothetical protein Ct9H300mP23_07580 [Nitrospinota bacterium]